MLYWSVILQSMFKETLKILISKTWVIMVFVLFVLFFSGGYFFGIYAQKARYTEFLESFRTLRENADKYSFINPLIGGIAAPATDVGIFSDIKKDVVDYLMKEEKKGNLYDFSFYFRDMTTGLWFGENEMKAFFPASLLKLPIAIAVYKQGEDNLSFLSTRLVYTEEIANLNKVVQTNSESTLVVGASYTIDELVQIMLTVSDNGAKDLLLSALDIKYLNQLFSLVALIDPGSTKTYTVSSRQYALFLRVLYGSSYLNEEHSEYLLKLLLKSDFKDGLVAGVPGSVPVSHKYGAYQMEEHINGVLTSVQQLHDCGIIYHSQRPYIFCFMTKGKDAQTLFAIISKVSRMLYNYQEEHMEND